MSELWKRIRCILFHRNSRYEQEDGMHRYRGWCYRCGRKWIEPND